MLPLLPVSPPMSVPVFSGFDYVTVDSARRRVYAAHTGSEALLIVDADTGKVLGQVKVGPLHGVAVDPESGHVYTGDGESDSVSEIDPVAMTVVRSADVAGKVDAIAYDSSNGRIYADEDDGTHMFVVDAKSMTSVGSVALPGHKPEYLAVDPDTHRIYQNIADLSEVVVVDPSSLKVVDTFATPEIAHNHPLQYDPAYGHIVVGGQNGTLATYDRHGALIGKTQIQDRVDQCTLEPASHLIACAGSGKLTLLSDEAAAGPKVLAQAAIANGAHTVAIDAAHRNAWIVWSSPDGDFVQAFSADPARAAAPSVPAADQIQMVVVVTRHGVRSPTKPKELAPYAHQAWPKWEVPPGYLTPHGARLMRDFGVAYRSIYSAAGLFAATGCPVADSVYVWADLDQRTRATGKALLDGFAPGCGIETHVTTGAADTLFDAVPTIARADNTTALAALKGGIGIDAAAVFSAYRAPIDQLDAILGCAHAACTPLSSVPLAIAPEKDSGLTSVEGPFDIASTAVEDFILEYTDGMPPAKVGWGYVDAKVIRALTPLHTLKYAFEKTPYATKVEGSNIVAHIAATLDLGASGMPNAGTRVPAASKFVAFMGHDSTLEEMAGVLHLTWLLPGYQVNDTPPGGALVFEVHRSGADAPSTVRLYYTAQSLEEMHDLSAAQPARVPVYIPGCPRLDCPLPVFDAIVKADIDPAFVGAW